MSCRLPSSVKPTHYDLNVTTLNLTAPFLFRATVTINLETSADATDDVTLHCLDLSIDAAHIDKTPATKFSFDAKMETVTISFPPNAVKKASTPTLKISFYSHLNDQMRGLYRSQYTDRSGTSKFMATTQHEPTDARRFFPCWDEPACKATFQTTVLVPPNLTAVSNTNVIETNTNPDNSKKVIFAVTPKMSTYLHALVVGEFDTISISNPATNIITSVMTMPGLVDQGRFCLDTADKCLAYQAGQFGVPYPLPKSDLLAIPDFAAGAMENWGCVTYREAKILTKEGATSLPMRKGIARTVCHELAHQWFGNLVTMDWWDGLFLNEGFARFMEFRSCNHIFPQWKIWDEFVQSVYNLALSLDSMETSHPVFVEVNHPDEINHIFDAISYAKGASLLRMCSSYVGDEVFMGGIRAYLKKHAYGNTKPTDLWGAIENVSGKPIVDLMMSWTTQVGYPVLTVTDTFSITQQRFLASGSNDDASLWTCPVSVVTPNNTSPPILLSKKTNDELKPLLSAEETWFKINASESGFFIVNYTDAQWDSLRSAVLPGVLSNIDRLGLISDCFRLARAGYTSINNALNLIKDFANIDELDEYVVWQEVCDDLHSSLAISSGEPFEEKFQAFAQALFAKQFANLGWDANEGEGETNIATFRASVLKMMVASGDKDVIQEGAKRFNNYVNGGEAIDADSISAVYKMALKFDEADTYVKLLTLYEKTTFPEEQRRLLMALGAVKDEGRWSEMIEYVLYSGNVRLQDVAYPLSVLGSASKTSTERAYNYLTTNFDQLQRTFANGQMWPSIVFVLVRGGETVAQAEKIEAFFTTHDVGSAKKRVAQAVEKIRVLATRKERESACLAQYFQ